MVENLNKCFDCQKYSCDDCLELEPEMRVENDATLLNPETGTRLTKADIDGIMGRR